MLVQADLLCTKTYTWQQTCLHACWALHCSSGPPHYSSGSAPVHHTACSQLEGMHGTRLCDPSFVCDRRVCKHVEYFYSRKLPTSERTYSASSFSLAATKAISSVMMPCLA